MAKTGKPPVLTETILIRVTPEQRELLVRHAADNYTSISMLLRPSIEKVIEAISAKAQQAA